MEYMRLWNMSLTTDIVRVMARVERVGMRQSVKTDWEMVRRTLGNCREEGTMRLQEVEVYTWNMPSGNIKTEIENMGVTIK